MASTSASLPAHDAVQVLVSSLADESSLVREASMSSLKEIAPLDPQLVLSCCSSVSRGGRRRFGNMAGVFQVMACAVKAIDKKDVDPALMEKLTKIATSEMITSKEINAEWQRSAASLLVSIGSHEPDLMMGEIFLHLSGPNAAIPSMVQILAEFASVEALQFTPRLKDVLLRLLPILGNVRDIHKPIFANAFKCWCEAVWQCRIDFHYDPLLDADVMSFLNSVFELLLRSWANSRDTKVRLSSVEALGLMVGLITRNQIKAALPRLIPSILDLCRKDQECAFISICSLQNLLDASLLSESGPPLLDFEDLLNILHTLLPIACINITAEHSNFSVRMKTYNEVQHCFVVIGSVYPEDLLAFLLNKCQSKDELSIVGSLSVLKHLLPRLFEAWHGKRPMIVDTVKLLLDEENFNIRMALSELLVVMASHCYLTGPSGESFIEYLVRHCALSDEEINRFKTSKEVARKNDSLHYKEVKIGAVSPEELRAVCEKGLLLLTVTIPEIEHILWPFILKLVIPKKYTGAVATICKCITELSKHKFFRADSLLNELVARNDIPTHVELFARFIVLLHDPLARDQLSTHILTVLCQLAPLFPKNISLFWQDEVPKMKAYISDPDDLKQDSSYIETWDDMIINFLAESLDVVRDVDWIISLGNAFCRQYDLYAAASGHSAVLHRCLGILLQKVDDRPYVRDKIDWMYKNADISIPTNRLGLAKGMGLVAASHLDTVLDKLKNILDNVGLSKFRRFFSFFYGISQTEEVDDVHAALALMYGYAARYAPSTVIESRIDALVGTDMLSRLLHVQHPTAKQAVITAIDLLGLAVINASDSGISFPLKRRDQMLEFVLTLMGRDDRDDLVDSNVQLLHTQNVALSACTTLVSLEPKLPMETRNHVMKATLGFFALPNNPADVMDQIIDNLITLLCAILLTSGEDGRSRAEQLLHILRQVDQYVSSSVEHQRKRGCLAVYELLSKFRALCSGGHCSLGCRSSSPHSVQIERALQRNYSNLPSAFLLPSRESLSLGERVITYIPRCADTSSDVRKSAVQIIDLIFSISLSLPKLVGSKSTVDLDIEMSYSALYSLEDVISILRRDASIDQSEVFNRVISSVCTLLTRNELVISLHACNVAICDKIKQSAEGAVQAVTEFICRRGRELSEAEVSRTTHSLISATMSVADKHSRQEVLNAVSCLAENTHSDIVFNDVLAAAGRDIVTKDISRLRGGWPMQDAFHAFSQHPILSSMFLEHIINVLNQTPFQGNVEKIEGGRQSFDLSGEEDLLQASVAALTSLFRGGGKIGRKSVENSYAIVLSALTLQLGSCHGLVKFGLQEPLRSLLNAFRSFCECVGDLEMGKILTKHTEQNGDKWIDLVGELACCISIKRPREVPTICMILNKALDRSQRFQREAAAAALSEFIRYSDGVVSVLEQIVETMCIHVSDESPSVRSLCLKGLVQIPKGHMLQYIPQFLGVITALLEDPDDSVQLTAVQCLMMVLEESPNDAVDHVLLNISLRLRNLQISLNAKMRANAFAAYGLLSKYGNGTQLEAFLEQVHGTFPRLIFHVHDDDISVRQACRNALRLLAPLTEVDSFSTLFNTQCFNSDHRSDYEDFLRDLTRQLSSHFAGRADTYLASAIQAFDAPWPIIQANAVYFSCCLLSLLDDQRSYFAQVFGMIVSKLNRSQDSVVRSACSFALGALLRASKPQNWAASPIDRTESALKPGV